MSDDTSARLALSYLAAGQMQKHVTLNDTLTRLDALVQTGVISRSLVAQPESPADGDLYLLPSGATGVAWAGRPGGTLMRFEAAGWSVVPVPDGTLAVVLDEAVVVLRQGADWVPVGQALGEVRGLGRFGLNTVADEANPFAARLNAALWTALDTAGGGTGDLRMALNKADAGAVLSLLFQSAYGGRAELGLIGDDILRLKVSADGAAWHEAFRVEGETGRVSFDRGAVRRERVVFTEDGTWSAPAWARTVEAVCIGGGGGGAGGASGGSGVVRLGGGGGAAGGVSRATWSAGDLSAGLVVTVGAGGTGGAAGAGGGHGQDSGLQLAGQPVLTGRGGSGGGPASGGLSTPGERPSNGGGNPQDGSAGEAGRMLNDPFGPGGGGAGGSIDAADVAWSGGVGGTGSVLASPAGGGSAGPGAVGGAGQNAGLSGGLSGGPGGGGGGGGSANATGSGFAGGEGGRNGAGGAGGGAGSTGGPGGTGGSGCVLLTVTG